MKSRVVIALIAALLSSCKKSEEKKVEVEEQSSLYLYADVKKSDAPPAARFATPMPTSASELVKKDAVPPQNLIRSKLASGDKATEDRVLAALRTAAEKNALEEKLTAYYRGLFEYNTTPKTCELLARALAGDHQAAIKNTLSPPFARCTDTQYDAFFMRPDTPSEVVLERYFEGERSKKTFTPRLESAARELAAKSGRWEIRKLGIVLAELDDPKAIALAIELHGKITDPERRAAFGVGFGLKKGHAEAHKIFLASCRHHELSKDPLCPETNAPVPPATAKTAAAEEEEKKPAPSAALETKLRDFGLVRDDKKDLGANAEEILINGGRASRFDTETGQFPNEHDALLFELAGLASPALDDVLFEEIAPPEDQMDEGEYLLRAYAGGKKIETPAENLGDWYDLGAVLGLLNVVLRDRQSMMRYVVLPTGDQTATVLVGPMKGLEDAKTAGLIEIEGAGAAIEAGKNFENRVLQQLMKNGQLEEK